MRSEKVKRFVPEFYKVYSGGIRVVANHHTKLPPNKEAVSVKYSIGGREVSCVHFQECLKEGENEGCLNGDVFKESILEIIIRSLEGEELRETVLVAKECATDIKKIRAKLCDY